MTQAEFLRGWDGVVLSFIEPSAGSELTTTEAKAVLGAGQPLLNGEGWLDVSGDHKYWSGTTAPPSGLYTDMNNSGVDLYPTSTWTL